MNVILNQCNKTSVPWKWSVCLLLENIVRASCSESICFYYLWILTQLHCLKHVMSLSTLQKTCIAHFHICRSVHSVQLKKKWNPTNSAAFKFWSNSFSHWLLLDRNLLAIYMLLMYICVLCCHNELMKKYGDHCWYNETACWTGREWANRRHLYGIDSGLTYCVITAALFLIESWKRPQSTFQYKHSSFNSF